MPQVRLTRRGLLKGLLCLPIVGVLGVPHVHNFQKDPTFRGYSCECGEIRYEPYLNGLMVAAHTARESGQITWTHIEPLPSGRYVQVYNVRWEDEAARPIVTVEKVDAAG